MKTLSMPLDKYYQIVKPTYVYLKIVPHKSNRNQSSNSIAKSISSMFKSISQRIEKIEKKYIYHTQWKCAYMIDIYKGKTNDISFYFIIPSYYKNLALEKIKEVWNKSTVEEVTSIKSFTEKSNRYEVCYKKEDALSLMVDKTTNEPLNSMLNVLDIMEDGDRVSILYNFQNYSQYVWQGYYKNTIEKWKEHRPLEKTHGAGYFSKLIGTIIIDIIESLLNVFFDLTGSRKKENIPLLESLTDIITLNNRKLSNNTLKKKNDLVLRTQIVVVSESNDKYRQDNNGMCICNSFRSLDEDNELVYKKVSVPINIEETKFRKIKDNIFSTNECQNFIQVPGRTLLEAHNIEHVNTTETIVPIELQGNTKFIGTSTCKGVSTKVQLTKDKDYKNLAVAIIGPTRSGKTSLLGNLARDSIKNDECVIVLDYIENCGLSEDIKKCILKDKILEINLHDYKKLQGLGYNEAIKETTEPFLIYESAKQQASQVSTLINSLNVEGSEFTPKMARYLNAACLIAFINKGGIKDVLMILQDYKIRNKFIKNTPKDLLIYLDEYIIYLKELDEWSKATKENASEVIGTKLTNIVGILDRFSKLKENTYMEMMLKKGIEDNINLYEEMEKNQCIFIKMPENMFATAEERDVMTTYWLTKIWMAGQVRAWKIPNRYKRKTVTVITDEIAQLSSAEKYLGSKLDQTAKFGIKFILSTMYLNQLKIREKLRTANTSYIFIAGADKQNFKELKEEFLEKDFELEDMQKLKRYHALNYIKYEQGYWAGITKLPLPIKS